MPGDGMDRRFQAFAINLAVNRQPAVKSTRADVLQQVWDFRKRPPLAVLRRVEVAKFFSGFGDRLCGPSPCFHRHARAIYKVDIGCENGTYVTRLYLIFCLGSSIGRAVDS